MPHELTAAWPRPHANNRQGRIRRSQMILRVISVLAAAAFGAVACGSNPATSSSSGSNSAANDAPASVHVEATLNLVSAPLLLALGPDYLGKVAAQFHTKFTYTPGTSSSVQIANLLGGVDQFYTPVSPAILPPVAAGKDVKLINQLSLNGTQLLIGALKYKSGRGSAVSAYRAGTWCYSAPGSASENALEAAARDAGIDWSQVHGVSLGSSTAFLPTMQEGRCDLSAEDATDAAKAISQGVGYLVQNQAVESVSNRVFDASSPLVGAVLATTASFAGQYPALTQAVDTALVKAELFLQYHASDPGLIYSKMPSVYTARNSATSFKEQWQLVAPSFTIGSGIFSTPSINATVGYLKSLGDLPSAPSSMASAFVNSFTINAYAMLGLPKPAADGTALSSEVLQQHSSAVGL